jgi:hypothetical protein
LQNKKGGKRKGAGRKPLPFKTSVIYKRVPEQIKDKLIAHIDSEVEKFVKNNLEVPKSFYLCGATMRVVVQNIGA